MVSMAGVWEGCTAFSVGEIAIGLQKGDWKGTFSRGDLSRYAWGYL